MTEEPLFFQTPEEFRKWLEANHTAKAEQWIGFYKKHTGLPSITWSESVDQALCYGWIDGLRKTIDEQSYKIRFTPRNPKSHWSTVNLNKMQQLIKHGLVTDTGLNVYNKRDPSNTQKTFFEQKYIELPPEFNKELQGNEAAWSYYKQQSNSYRKQVNWWVCSAKKEGTRLKRFKTLLECCEIGEVIPPMRYGKNKK